MKDKLIKLLQQADKKCNDTKQCENCVGFGHGNECFNHLIADYLLENGVVVLPFPIGTTYYRIVTKRAKVGFPYHKVIRKAELNWYNLAGVIEDLGTTVFLTKEGAEKALDLSAEEGEMQ